MSSRRQILLVRTCIGLHLFYLLFGVSASYAQEPMPVAMEVTLAPEQFNTIVYAIVFVGMCICACLGANAHEGAAR